MRIKITNKDIIWSYAGTIMNMGSNLLMLPFIVYYLDNDMLGIWYVFGSIGAVALLFDFGFAVTFSRNITYCWSGTKELKKENVVFSEDKMPNFYLMKKVLYTCKCIYFLISISALIFLLVFGTMYVLYISRYIQGNTHIIAWVIYAVAIFLNLYYGYYASFLRGVGAIDSVNKNTIIARSIQIIFSIVLLKLGSGIIGVCIAHLTYGFVFRVLGKYKFFSYKNIGEELDKIVCKFTSADIKELYFIIWHNAWRDGIISFSDYLCNQASVIVCSLYLSLGETGVYSLAMQIAQAIASIAGTLYIAYQPTLQEAYISKKEDEVREIMSVIVISYIAFFILGVVGASTIVVPMIKFIRPEKTVPMILFWGLCFYQFILKLRNCYTSYFSCTNRIIYVNGFVCSSVLCIIFSFIMLGILNMNVYGLIVAQIVSQIVYNIWKWPMKAHKEMHLSVKNMLKIGINKLDNIFNLMLKK